MRTLVNIPDADVHRLDALAATSGRSRAAEIRDAVKRHLAERSDKSWIQAGAGYWADRTDIGDGVDYQRAMREDQDLGYPWPPHSSTPTS